MIHPFKVIWLLVVLALLMPSRQVFATPTADTVSDIRILIDVSGSMKNNDPNNLRAPALRLIVGLLPEDSKAGTWTFGKYVNMLVPFRDVNDAWKLEAELQSKNIHSYGLFTNIEQALKTATANQKGIDSRYRRSVILLSDGLVDVSKNDEINKKSRQRILDEIVPRLKKNNVAVHTIALSDSADHQLLRAISVATDGWYEQVDNADQLQRVFLHLFEKAAMRDTVPLVDNQFKIDDSVSEMTLLVFRRESSSATELLLPDQSRISQKNMPNNVRWHSEGNYDLVTIDKPVSGHWLIDADIDPDNRVMVVTDLQLKTTDLPNNIVIGETFDFDVNLTEKDEVIVRQDFLKLVDANLKQETTITAPFDQSLNEQQVKGAYRTHVGENFQPGRNDVVVTMTSPTFERQRRQSINVVETPFDIDIEQLEDQVTRTHRLTLIPDVDLIKVDKLNIAAMLTAEDGSEWSYEVMKISDEEWQLTLTDLNVAETYTVALQIRAETVKGRSLFLQPALIALRDTNTVTESKVLTDMPEQEVFRPEIKDEISGSIIEEEPLDVHASMEKDKQDALLVQQSIPVDTVVDEMVEDVEDLKPEIIDDEASAVEVGSDIDQDIEENMTPAIQLAIGNGFILLLIGLGIYIWRRKSATSTNPGEQL